SAFVNRLSMSNMYVLYLYFFFFSSRRRHTRSKRDWSSDVCSSDLERPISKIFTQRQGAYHKAISELLKLLPEEEQEQKRESLLRSEERRVGKECRYRGLVYGKKEQENKKKRRHKARIKITP